MMTNVNVGMLLQPLLKPAESRGDSLPPFLDFVDPHGLLQIYFPGVRFGEPHRGHCEEFCVSFFDRTFLLVLHVLIASLHRGEVHGHDLVRVAMPETFDLRSVRREYYSLEVILRPSLLLVRHYAALAFIGMMFRRVAGRIANHAFASASLPSAL